jgi:negative regulator of sigma E activity
MSEPEKALKVQACVDGELPDAEAKAFLDSIRQDEQLQLIHQHLRSIKSLMHENELEHPVQETREFYWAQIQRSIAAAPAGRATHASSLGWLLRWLVPVGATALLCAYWLMPVRPGAGSDAEADLLVGHEIETPLEDTTSFAFRSESAGMTIVWVETRGMQNMGLGD